MKKITLLLLIFKSAILFSQTPKFDANDAAGIFYYNIDEVIKEVKIKNDKIKSASTKAIIKHNDKIKEISFLNSLKLNDLELLVKTANKNVKNLNQEQKTSLRNKIQSIIIPVRDSIAKSEKTLNSKLEATLSKKQNKKWLRYQTKQKKKLLPKQKTQQRNRSAQNLSRRDRMNRRY